MSEAFLGLAPSERAEALEAAAFKSGRPAYLLEKDVWMVWSIEALFTSSFGADLCFKGGTSLSKAYRVITRFSEDVDLTYDIRALLPDVGREGSDPFPASRSQERKWTKMARKALAQWVRDRAIPIFGSKIDETSIPLSLRAEEEKLYLAYESAVQARTSYVAPEVLLDFGARSTGAPIQQIPIACDAAEHLPMLSFPAARPRVMAAERTFWEKATAMHVYCLQEHMPGERYSRHWYDVVQLDRHGIVERALADTELALRVARHKGWFFREKDAKGDDVDYEAAVRGSLRLVPDGNARERLADDYARMTSDGLLPRDAPSFDELMAECNEIQTRARRAGTG